MTTLKILVFAFATSLPTAAFGADNPDAATAVPQAKAKPPIPADPVEYERTQPLFCRPQSWFDLGWRSALNHALDASILNFLHAYDQQCGTKMSARERALWARETAHLMFLAGDNAGCLKVLDAVRDYDESEAVANSLALQRAECGGTCTLKPKQCKDAKETRENVHRRLQRRNKATAAARLCRQCIADPACKAKAIMDLAYIYPGTGNKYVHTDPNAPNRYEQFKNVDDFNGDGIADLIRGSGSRRSCVSLDEPAEKRARYNGVWTVYLGCGQGRYIPTDLTFEGCDVIPLSSENPDLQQLCFHGKDTMATCWLWNEKKAAFEPHED